QAPGLLPESVTRALDFCRADAAGDAELSALLDREHDMLDLVALQGDFPEALSRSYSALAADPERRRAYLDMLAGFHRIEGRPPTAVEGEIATLVDSLLADSSLRALVAGAPPAAPDPAQREVLRRTLTALGVVL